MHPWSSPVHHPVERSQTCKSLVIMDLNNEFRKLEIRLIDSAILLISVGKTPFEYSIGGDTDRMRQMRV
jgi:hypothetical protein